MKRILYSCLSILFLFLFGTVKSQASFSIGPNPQCANASGVYTAQAGVVVQFPGADDYTWTVNGPVGCNITWTPVPLGGIAGSPLANTGINITIPCEGEYFITAIPMFGGFPIGGSLTCNEFFSGDYDHGVIFNSSMLPITSNPASAICAGETVTLSTAFTPPATAAFPFLPPPTYVWNPGAIAGSSVAVSPTANTCFSVIGTVSTNDPAQPTCTVMSTSCVSVQTQSLSITPASQTICAGGCALLTASASSNSVNIVWNPAGITTSSTNFVCAAGIYTAVGTYTGIAGTCTTEATAAVVVGTSLSINVTASSLSVCPNTLFTLTANPNNAISTYTWLSSGPGGLPSFGTVISPTATRVTSMSSITSVRLYTVGAIFPGNCPGIGTITISIKTLTPTLTASSPSICPNTAVTLSATGGVNYTFQTIPGGPPATIATGTNNTASHAPSTLSRPYIVIADSAGCLGSATTTVYAYSITPTMAVSSISNCPNSTFTLSALSSLYSYTFSSVSPPNPISPIGALGSNSATSSSSSFPATYSVVADSLGCKGTAAITVFSLNFTPTLTASSLSVCPNTNFTLVAHGGITYTVTPPTTVPPTPVTLVVGTKSVVSTTSSFPATYTLTMDSAGCVGRTTTLSINNLTIQPRFGIALNTTSICPTSAITFTAGSSSLSSPAGILTYTFYNGTTTPTVIPSSPATASATSYTVPAGFTSGTFSLTADSLGCRGGTTITLYRRVLQPTLTLSSPSICANTCVTLTANGVGAGANYTFIAHPTNAAASATTILQNLSNPQPTVNWVAPCAPGPSVATEYTVRVDSAGCTNLPIIATSTVLLDMIPALTPTIAYTLPTVCAGQESTLSIQNHPTYTLTWVAPISGGTLQISVDSVVVVTPSVPTTYSVYAIDPLGCIGNASINIGINPAPLLNLTTAVSPATICAGQTTTMTVTGGATYTWAPVSVVAPINGSIVVGSPNATTIYTVTGNNGYGCIGSKTVQAFVGNYPNLSIVASANAVCAGFQATLTAQGAGSYTWTGTTLTSPIYQNAIAVTPGTYTLTGSNGGTCIKDTTKVIVLQPNFSLTVSQSSPTTCIISNYPKYSKPVTLTASGGGGIYTWFPCDPNYMSICVGPIVDPTPPATTCYTVTSVTSVCSGSAVSCVTVIPQFTMNVTPPLPIICAGDSIKLSVINISTLAVGAPNTFTYSWTEPEPGITSDLMTPTVMVWPGTFPSALNSGAETWTVDVRDTRQCVSLPRLVTVTVLPRPMTSILIPTVNTVPTNTVCYMGNMPGALNSTIELKGINQNMGLSSGVTPTYTWMAPPEYFGYNPFITPINNNWITIKAPLRLPSVVVYTLQSGFNGVPGCKALDTVSVRVVDCRPVSNYNVRFTSDVQEICTQQCVSFMNLVDTAAGGPQQYLWKFPGGAPATSTLANPTVCYNLPGPQNVILYVTNPYPGPGSSITETTSTGFTSRATYIKVVDIPNVTIVPPGEVHSDTLIRFGQSVKLVGSGATSYSWSPDYNINALSGASVIVNPNHTTQYILMGYNNKNCFSSDTINVIVVEDCGEMFIPNAFSPNGDGHNDKLYVRGVCLQSLTFMIFDRWGEKVFETNTQSEGWDGKYKGEDMNSGVFVYRLEGKTYDGKAYSLKGNITLIR